MSTHFIILLKTHGIDNIKELLHVLISLMLCFICICILERSKENGLEVECNFILRMIILCTGIIQIHTTALRELITFYFSLEPMISVVLCCIWKIIKWGTRVCAIPGIHWPILDAIIACSFHFVKIVAFLVSLQFHQFWIIHQAVRSWCTRCVTT